MSLGWVSSHHLGVMTQKFCRGGSSAVRPGGSGSKVSDLSVVRPKVAETGSPTLVPWLILRDMRSRTVGPSCPLDSAELSHVLIFLERQCLLLPASG